MSINVCIYAYVWKFIQANKLVSQVSFQTKISCYAVEIPQITETVNVGEGVFPNSEFNYCQAITFQDGIKDVNVSSKRQSFFESLSFAFIFLFKSPTTFPSKGCQWAGPAYFYLAHGHNGLSIMGYNLVNGSGWAEPKEKTSAYDPAYG